jgi:hypothetical protein
LKTEDQMANNAPVLITRVHIGKGPGIVLISMASPSGELGRGPVDNVETVRLAMTHSTFREVADLFSQTVAEIQAEEPGQKVGARRPPLHAMAGPLKN